MINIRMIIKAFSILIVLISFLACSKEGKPPAAGVSPQQGTQMTPTAGGNNQQLTAGTTKVRVIPEAPTVLTDLQANYSGVVGKVTYAWQRNGQPISGEISPSLARGKFIKGDTITATIRSDGFEGSASIVIGNTPPEVATVAFSPERIMAGTDIMVTATGNDPDGDAVSFHYKWSINGQELINDTPELSKDRFKCGDTLSLRITPYDNVDEGVPFDFRSITIPNAPPRITSSAPLHFEDYSFVYQLKAEDPDRDPVTFSLAIAPPGMTIDSKTGLITWQLTDKSVGTNVVEVVAQDPQGLKDVQNFTLSITLPEGGAK